MIRNVKVVLLILAVLSTSHSPVNGRSSNGALNTTKLPDLITTTLVSSVTSNSTIDKTDQNSTATITAETNTSTTNNRLTREQSLIGFAVAGTVLIVVCGYFMISYSVRRYRRWQLNRLLLSIRGDDDSQDGDGDRRPLINERLEADPLGGRRRNERRGDSSSNSTASGSLGSPPRRRGPSTDSFGMRASNSNVRINEADDFMVTPSASGHKDGGPFASSSRVSANDRALDADDPILVLGDEMADGLQSRNESLI